MGWYKVAQGWFELTLDCPRWGGWVTGSRRVTSLTHPRVKGLADLCDQTVCLRLWEAAMGLAEAH